MARNNPNVGYPVFGMTGTVASGKDTAANRLVNEHGFFHVSTSDIVRAEAMKLHGTNDRDILHNVANDIRLREGVGALCVRSVNVFLQEVNPSERTGLVISGIRALGEGQQVQAGGGKIIFVDADPRIRYERLLSRSRNGEITNSFDDFLNFEQLEEHSQESHAQNLSAIRNIADHVIYNNHDYSIFVKNIDGLLTNN